MMSQKQIFDKILSQIREKINSENNRDSSLQFICTILKDNVEHYNWVGFYLTEGADNLVLGPFSGAPTVHTRIKFGIGICGQAAETKRIFIVQDVSKELNYLSCSPTVKSEIVLPILKTGNVVGELDIDSHKIAPFTDDDKEFLLRICSMVVKYF
ncbi:TPA: gaf sensor protein [candidate division WOR-3 bacterium]|uniref:Gaf sensor protein n=1 Tax=candidate division WOR-3 bacterium TaxID=2052148 RepID=A0A350H851_UNCW3|nr:gaf sensor protein [candidate division WOR-3 bacterium]